MKKYWTKLRISITISLSSLCLMLIVAFANNDFKILKSLDIYYSLFKEVNLYYVDETDPEKLINTSIKSMLSTLDPYTVFIPEAELDNYKFITTGEYGGIGASVRRSENSIIINYTYEGSPAQKAGLKAGDIIYEINGKSPISKNSEDVTETLKGNLSSSIELLIKRPGDTTIIRKTLIREKITISNIPYFGLIKSNIGYIKLSSFTEDANIEVKNALIELKKQGAKSIILDLRGNPGGLLVEAINILNLFVDKGQVILNTKGKVKQWNVTYTTKNQAIDKNIPLVVMVNKNSASAAEIVSGALQDLDRAVIIGQRTYGKGLVQTTRSLSYNTKLKVTTAKYYTPSGRCIQAMDYSHRNGNGIAGRIPDSLMHAFKTKNGRNVLDGGGILPDIEIKPDILSKLAYNLYSKYFIFDYATQYVLRHESIPTIANFKFTNQDYTDFIEFLKTKNFDYKTDSEETLDKLKETAVKEKYMEGAKAEFEALAKKLAHDKINDFEKNKKEIIELIEEEIASRYYYQRGKIQISMKTDPLVAKALEIITDKKRYSHILQGIDKPSLARNYSFTN
ncbi:MAG: S41 family peptidase [Bacteroidota bacterium]|nr:S41 family peptidase [Bacteroidota bacterium]